MPPAELSLDEARRIALAAQGFDRARPSGTVTTQHLRRAIHQLGLLQLDFVNVLVPAHYQVLFSRLGPYNRSRLDHLVYTRREFTEQWAHEASIVPVETWPLLRHRMEKHRVRPWGFEKFMAQNPAYVERVLEEVRARGPIGAGDLPDADGVPRRIQEAISFQDSSEAWLGTVPRATLEAHFGRGALAIAVRRPDFSRLYDLAERVIPLEHHSRTIGLEDAQRQLLRQAARSHGIGTAADLADYYRMPVRVARDRLAELIEAGELRQVRVEGWREPAYLHPEAKLPPRIEAASLLSPFDPVVWYRPRTERLFHFEYRLEIYVPREKRRWGYYVLPFLLGDRLVARVDLKADRPARRLQVLAAYLEPNANSTAVAEALTQELQSWAAWLDLDSVAVNRHNRFARTLAAHR
jgi:uncharacterized protein